MFRLSALLGDRLLINRRTSQGGIDIPGRFFAPTSLRPQTFYYAAAFSQLIIHGIPKRSTHIPKRAAQKVSLHGHLSVFRQGLKDSLGL